MKTDLIEIFQTIRAELQPYAALGFTNRTNSDDLYDLWSEKNIEDENITERFFAEVKIETENVAFRYSNLRGDGEEQMTITELDDVLMKKIEDDLSVTFKIFKEKEWI